MPAPRKPTHLLKLAGAFKKNPKRAKAREGEPVPTAPLGARVERLNKLETACWDRLVAIAPPGAWMNSDEAMVEATARLWARLKSGKFTAADVGNLRLCLQQLGMTPAARSLVKVPEAPKGNRFADI